MLQLHEYMAICTILDSLRALLTKNASYNMVQVCRDPRWGRCYESYSEDHRVVQQMTDIILGLQGDIPINHTKGVPYIAGK